VAARDLEGRHREIRCAKQRFNLPDDAPVVSGHETEREGCWLRRYVDKNAIANIVDDGASTRISAARKIINFRTAVVA